MAKTPWYIKLTEVTNKDGKIMYYEFKVHWLWRLWIEVKLACDLDVANRNCRP
jgi:hypothetical protein